MAQRSRLAISARQSGAALLALMLLIFLGASALFLKHNSAIGARHKSDQVTALAMAQAKEALIGRAATDDNRPGSLTCPDIDDDGVADGAFGNCSAYIGRLPWKTLDVPELLDGNGDRLWYALSPGIRDNEAAQPISPTKVLELSLDGKPNIAAILFSAGPPLADQNGRPSNTVSDYLDGSNKDGDSAYVSGPQSQSFNDKALAITREDIFRTANQRVLAEIRGPDDNPLGAPTNGLRHYHAINGLFPWADSGSDGIGDGATAIGNLPYAELSTSPASLSWLNANGWLPLVTYERIDANSVRISIGTSTMDVKPCPSSPCP